MARYNKTNVVVGDTVKSDVNVQLGLIETAISDSLSRKGDVPNAMEADLDLNSNDILNVNTIAVNAISVGGADITASVLASQTAAEASAAAALVSENASAANAVLTAADAVSTAADVVSTAANLAAMPSAVTSVLRKSKLDNPLCHLFKTNKLAATSAPSDTTNDVSWTRASTATYVDRYGVVKYSPSPSATNLMLQSEAFGTTWAVAVGATIDTNATEAPDGSVTADRYNANGGSFPYVDQTISSSGEITFSIFVKKDTSDDCTLRVNGTDVGQTGTSNSTWNYKFSTNSFTNVAGSLNARTHSESIGNEWFRLSITVTTTTVTTVRIYSEYDAASVGSLYLWGAQVEASRVANGYVPTTTVAVTGTTSLTLAPDTVGREETEGWLIEGASTNLCLRSEEFDNASWIKTNATINANSVVAPDGTTTGDTFNRTAPGFAIVEQSVTASASTVYTFSCWLKGDGAQTFVITAFDIGGVQTPHQLSVTPPVEWTRYSLTWTTVVGTTSIILQPIRDDAGSTTSIDIWGAQIEALPFASSYIPTTTASVTRAADDVSCIVENNFVEGATTDCSSSFTYDLLGDTGASQRLYTTKSVSGSNSRYYLLSTTTVGSLIYRDGSAQSSSKTTSGILDTHNAVTTTESLGMTVYVEGVAGDLIALTPDTTLNTAETLNFGTDEGGSLPMYGHLKDFRIYDFALNADEAQYLAD